MSAIRKDQLDNASAFMNEFWKELVKPYYNAEESDAWWDEMIRRTGEIGHKYCENDMRLMKILVGFQNGLSEVWRGEHGRTQRQAM